MLQLKVTKNLIARVKQIYRQQMPLLCNVSENESIWIAMNLGTRGRGGGGGSNTMAGYCVQDSLQIRPSESLIVCE